MQTLTQWIEINLENAKFARDLKVDNRYWEGYLDAIEALQIYLESRQDSE
jgi:hypothetical protein